MKDWKDIVKCYEGLVKATTYTKEYVKWGSSCDSSGLRYDRMEYIHKAMEAEDVKKLVLEKAAILAYHDIMGMSDLYSRKIDEIDQWLSDNKLVDK